MELGTHTGSGKRFNMYLSAPNGGVAQMLAHPEGMWVSFNDYSVAQDEINRLCAYGRELESKLGLAGAELTLLKAEVERLKNNVAYLDTKLDEELDK